MKKIEIMNKMPKFMHKAGFQLKKHSPEILVVAGVVGTVTSTVMACKATTKLSAVLEEAKKDINTIHQVSENPEAFNVDPEIYTEEDSKKDLAIVYAQTGIKIAKLYAPAIALGALSITSIIASHHIIRKRNMALAAAYTMIDKSFKEYRGRVVDRFGKELDRELRYNIKAKEIEEEIVDDKGKKKKVKTTVNVIDPNQRSDYARIFDEYCVGWSKDAEYNLMFLKAQQAHANDLLKSKGHLFLNEVYDMLGMRRSRAGQVVGWIYDESRTDRDNFVDFGIYDLNNEAARRFVNGYERNIILDFNVDGVILDQF